MVFSRYSNNFAIRKSFSGKTIFGHTVFSAYTLPSYRCRAIGECVPRENRVYKAKENKL